MITAVRELARSRELLYTLVERQLRLRAKRSWMSTAWPVIAPLLLMVLYVFVFKRVFDVPIKRYPVYLLCGLLPWVFLSQTLGKATTAVSSEAHLIRKAPFSYELMPISMVLAQVVNFLLTLSLLVAYLAVVGQLPYDTLPVLVFPVVGLTLLVMALSMILALVDVYNHDLRYVLGNLLTIWFFLVPIVYRPRMVPDSVRMLQNVDPVNLIVQQFRAALYGGRIDEPHNLVLMMVLCAALFLGCLVLFRSFASQIPKDV